MQYCYTLQNDTKKLAEAKQLVYLKGFTDGVLVVGEHAGKKASRHPCQCADHPYLAPAGLHGAADRFAKGHADPLACL
jgi:hypothetical protein